MRILDIVVKLSQQKTLENPTAFALEWRKICEEISLLAEIDAVTAYSCFDESAACIVYALIVFKEKAWQDRIEDFPETEFKALVLNKVCASA
ncbi:hypothetical protein ACFL2B_02070 [Patescibacteria group bacterium]